MADPKQPGVIGWVDLTVPDADRVSDFYKQVVGWETSAVDMGRYSDYCMIPAAGGDPIAGVCHARGVNADVPPVWLIYVNVPDVDASAKKVTELGGQVLVAPRSMAGGRFSVIRDPAGATLALFQQPNPVKN